MRRKAAAFLMAALAACGPLSIAPARTADSRASPPAAPAAPTAARCSPGALRLVPLPLVPVAISASGEVLGLDEARRAVRWRGAGGGLEPLPVPDGFERAEPVALNGRGDIVAVAVAGAGASERRRAYVVSGGRVIGLGGVGVRPFRIDDRGVIAGEAVLGTPGRSDPVIWHLQSAATARRSTSGASRPISKQSLATLPPSAAELTPHVLENCCGGTAKLLDGAGGIAGDLYDAAGRYHATRWRDGAQTQALRSNDRYSSALALNSHGSLVVVEFPRIWLLGSNGTERLTLAARAPSHPHALNDCELLVGDYGPNADALRAFAWTRAGGFTDLNARVERPPGWTLKSAVDVNDRGEIVGRAALPGDLERGFLLEPIEPSQN